MRSLCSLRKRLILAVAAGWLGASRLLAATEVRAEISAEEISPNDSLNLTVRVSGESLPRGIQPPALPPLVNLRPAGGPSSSTSFQWVNGRTSASMAFSWMLLPLKEGPASIPPIEVRVGQTTYHTEPLHVQVSARPSPGRGGRKRGMIRDDQEGSLNRGSGRDILVRAEVDRQRPFVGEPVILTYKLLTRARIARVSPDEPPSYNGFLADDVPVQPAETRRRVVDGGLGYDEYILARKILTSTEAGTKVIEPAAFRITAELPMEGDLLERFFRNSLREVMRQTERVEMEIRPLPAEGRPADFSGAVGKFVLKESTDRTDASTGDAVGFRVTLEGVGELRTASAPALPKLHDFRVYEPKLEEKSALDGAQRHVTRSWNYVLVPLAPGKQEIPAIRFSYFDPKEGVYRVATAGPTILSVRRGAESVAAVSPVARQEILPLRQELHYLKPLDRSLRRSVAPLYKQTSFLLLLGVPLLAPLVVSGFSAMTASGAGERLRRRRFSRTARRLIGRAAMTVSRGRPGEFYDALSCALVESVSERLEAPPFGLTYERIDEGLASAGVSEKTRQRYRRLLETCDSLRFAPAQPGTEDRKQRLSEAREILRGINRECRGRRLARTG